MLNIDNLRKYFWA